jgi:hypothetical protein
MIASPDGVGPVSHATSKSPDTLPSASPFLAPSEGARVNTSNSRSNHYEQTQDGELTTISQTPRLPLPSMTRCPGAAGAAACQPPWRGTQLASAPGWGWLTMAQPLMTTFQQLARARSRISLLSDTPRDFTLERVNRLTLAIADLTLSHASQGRQFMAMMQRLLEHLERIEAHTVAMARICASWRANRCC